MTDEKKVNRALKLLRDADDLHLECINQFRMGVLEIIDQLCIGNCDAALTTAKQLHQSMEQLEDALSARIAKHDDSVDGPQASA